MKLTAPATISKVSTLADGSIRIVADTQELQAEEMAHLFSLRNKLGWLLFSEAGLQEEDIPKDPLEVNTKSQSQRLRNTLFVYWQKKGIKEDFDTWKKNYIEKVIDNIKVKIDELN